MSEIDRGWVGVVKKHQSLNLKELTCLCGLYTPTNERIKRILALLLLVALRQVPTFQQV